MWVLISKAERAALLCPPAHLPRNIKMIVVLDLNGSHLGGRLGREADMGQERLVTVSRDTFLAPG